jgi:hypothetical protein
MFERYGQNTELLRNTRKSGHAETDAAFSLPHPGSYPEFVAGSSKNIRNIPSLFPFPEEKQSIRENRPGDILYFRPEHHCRRSGIRQDMI